MRNRVAHMLADVSTALGRPGGKDPLKVVPPKRWSNVPDNFDREVDEWFEKLEAQLAPAGRITPAGPEDEGQTGPVRPVLSHPSTL